MDVHQLPGRVEETASPIAPSRTRERAERRHTSGGTDRVLLVLLAALNVASAYTTLVGARQVLPWPMSDVLGVAVQTMLFLTLAGIAARHAPIRRWIVIGVFSAASVYTSFFAYYDQLAAASNEAVSLERARQAHAAFVDDVWQPVQGEVERLERESAQLYDQAEREEHDGLTTGQVGFGPVARGLAEQARQTELEASALRADLDRLAPRFEGPVDGLDAESLHLRDLDAWQHAPDDWKEGVSAPARADYLDLEQEVSLLTPYWKVRRGELPAWAALLLALVVDGTSILLGSAIRSRARPLLPELGQKAATLIGQVKDARAQVSGAIRQPGQVEDPPAPPPALDGALLVLRVTGRGSDFLGALYESIHPETGGLDAVRLLDHDDPSWRIGARVVLDRLRDPRVGWVRLDGGRWRVTAYDALTAWLADRYRAAIEEETALEHPERESVLMLPMPLRAQPGAALA